MNLDSSIRCSYTNGILRVEQTAGLPKDFWVIGEQKSRLKVVSNVSAIVGENGTGKTSVARYLAGLCSDATRYHRYLVVYKDGDKYFCVYKGYKVKLDGDVKISLRRTSQERSPFGRDLRLLYLTPHYAMPFDL